MNEKKTIIFFVDDDPMLLASTRRQLLKKLPDCELHFFEEAQLALEQADLTPPDLVLSDVRMPKMNGAEFLARIKTLSPGTIRLAWSGQSDGELLDQALEHAHEVFSKPIPTEGLVLMVTTVVELARDDERQPKQPIDQSPELKTLKQTLRLFTDMTAYPQRD